LIYFILFYSANQDDFAEGSMGKDLNGLDFDALNELAKASEAPEGQAE